MINKKRVLNRTFIKIISFTEKIPLNLNQISDDYFSRTGQTNYDNHDINDPLCIVCNDNTKDILIRPCGHKVLCQTCFKKLLEQKQECPMCRRKIKKAYLTAYDQEK